MDAVEEARSVFEAVQKLIGLSWSRLVALTGPAVASTWLYGAWTLTEPRHDMPSPLAILEDLASHAGFTSNRPASAAAWLETHEGLFLPALVSAIILACLAADSSEASGSWMSLSTLLLLGSVQMRGLMPIVVFVVVTMAFMATAILLDHRGRRALDGRWVSIPGLSFRRWVTGPGAVVGLPLFLPFLIVSGMVEAFRVEAPPMPVASGAVPSSLPPRPVLPKAAAT